MLIRATEEQQNLVLAALCDGPMRRSHIALALFEGWHQVGEPDGFDFDFSGGNRTLIARALYPTLEALRQRGFAVEYADADDVVCCALLAEGQNRIEELFSRPNHPASYDAVRSAAQSVRDLAYDDAFSRVSGFRKARHGVSRVHGGLA